MKSVRGEHVAGTASTPTHALRQARERRRAVEAEPEVLDERIEDERAEHEQRRERRARSRAARRDACGAEPPAAGGDAAGRRSRGHAASTRLPVPASKTCRCSGSVVRCTVARRSSGAGASIVLAGDDQRAVVEPAHDVALVAERLDDRHRGRHEARRRSSRRCSGRTPTIDRRRRPARATAARERGGERHPRARQLTAMLVAVRRDDRGRR